MDRAHHKQEPVAVVLWSPHRAYGKYHLTKLADPKGTWGANDQIRTLGNKSLPKKFPEFHGWPKNWKMTADELGSLEQDIQEAGKSNENKGVEKWIGDHPGIVDTIAPVM
ncbi:glycine betaine ABC transporter substrate-binding protein [Streptomyces sp. CT34]|uniref:glycine betaine ABC transporter substrate-binding protein n=1 Tax=Streptomyces sp. CT34 TaxID=1553907 RepID=UPI0005BDEF5F|nr:glycine betaine ABC transporter substrate-binding protein [Streptomyces sp. CT34]